MRYFGPWEIFDSFYLSIKIDRTPLQKFMMSAILCVFHPLLPIVGYLFKEVSDGAGYKYKGLERCVGAPGTNFGLDFCKQGFGILDYSAVLLISIPWWIWLPSLFSFRWVW